MSNRQAALAALRTRLEQILVANDFQTDAGKRVFFAEAPTLGPDDEPAAIAIFPQEDQPGYQGEQVAIVLPVRVEANVRADSENPGATVEAVIADIKKAVELDHDLGRTVSQRGLERGTTAPFDREEGSAFVGAAVTYLLRFPEVWGRP